MLSSSSAYIISNIRERVNAESKEILIYFPAP